MPTLRGDAPLGLGRPDVAVRARGSTTESRSTPSLRPRNSASARCEGTCRTGSLALK